MDVDVIVVGAGPTGLLLATELGLAGASATVLELLPTPSMQSKGGGIQPRTAEVFELRGLMAPLLERALPHGAVAGHFAGLPVELDCGPFGTRYPHPVSVPQAAVEAVLAEAAARRGVPIRRGHQVTDLHVEPDSVRVTVCAGGAEYRASAGHLVACDGGHSTVRRLLGVPFPGEAGARTSTVADVRLAAASASVPQHGGRMADLVHSGGGYWTMLSPSGDGRHRLVFGTLDPSAGPTRADPITRDEVDAVLRAVHGRPTRLGELLEGSRFTDGTRQLERYRYDRVLFAGDAAHVHPPLGGQGLNLGIQDAMNLGWKLAATVLGRAPAGLLDTYHEERHPVAAAVLRHTKAQRVLAERRPTPDVAALRDIVTELIRLPDANRYLAGLMSGLGLRYPMPHQPDDPLVGGRMPDLELTVDGRPGRVSELLHDGRGVLLSLAERPDLDAVRLPDGVARYSAKTAEQFPANAVLIRPDGHIGWASRRGELGTDGLRAALRRWFTPS